MSQVESNLDKVELFECEDLELDFGVYEGETVFTEARVDFMGM